MSYNTINQCANDSAFIARLTGAAAQEGAYDPQQVGTYLRWTIAGASDVEAAYASALAANNPNPGGDESVITDGMILAKMQENWVDTPGVDPPPQPSE